MALPVPRMNTTARKPNSLRTKDEAEALRILNAMNEFVRQPVLNLQIASALPWKKVHGVDHQCTFDPGGGKRFNDDHAAGGNCGYSYRAAVRSR